MGLEVPLYNDGLFLGSKSAHSDVGRVVLKWPEKIKEKDSEAKKVMNFFHGSVTFGTPSDGLTKRGSWCKKSRGATF